jgi:histidinol-phosphatase (PHP family)
VGAGVSLPADSHVHTEWSWDAQHGSMQRSCARAGGTAVAFGSDAHEPDRVADGFAAAAAVAEANGFRPAADPLALWTRS